jgi:hypothetical protein
MSNPTQISYARWERTTPAADRWQTLQTRLSLQTVSAASHWSRRSFVTCKWRALPAHVSAAVSHGTV